MSRLVARAGCLSCKPELLQRAPSALRLLLPLCSPVHPTHPVSRAMADLWMLFPTEQEYTQVRGGGGGAAFVVDAAHRDQGSSSLAVRGFQPQMDIQPAPCLPPPPSQWFTAAGFEDVQLKRIGPSWYRGVRRHGLIMGCSVTARKPAGGPSDSPLQLGPKAEVSVARNTNPLSFLLRVLLGSVGGFWYFLLPVYMWCVGQRVGCGARLGTVAAGSEFERRRLVTPSPCLPFVSSPCRLKNLVWPRTGPLADKF